MLIFFQYSCCYCLKNWSYASLWKPDYATLSTVWIKAKKNHCVLEFNQSQWIKSYFKFSIEKRIGKGKKNGNKDGKKIYKLKDSDVYGKTMESLINSINVRYVGNEKDYLKWTSKSICMSQKIFDNDLVMIHKSKVNT